MPAKKLFMRKIKEVLRLFWGWQQSRRQVAIQCGVSRPCVGEYLRRASDARLSWPLPQELDDTQLDRLLFPSPPKLPAEQRGVPDWAVVYEELRKKSVTKFLLWQEYRELNPKGYNYAGCVRSIDDGWVSVISPCVRKATCPAHVDSILPADNRSGFATTRRASLMAGNRSVKFTPEE